VWVRIFPSHLDANKIVNAASTSCNANWRAYEESAIFVQQQPHSDDHWLPRLPEHVRVLMGHRSA
jgi:hypothetical protein